VLIRSDDIIFVLKIQFFKKEKRRVGKRRVGKRRVGKRRVGKRRVGKRRVGKRRVGKRRRVVDFRLSRQKPKRQTCVFG